MKKEEKKKEQRMMSDDEGDGDDEYMFKKGNVGNICLWKEFIEKEKSPNFKVNVWIV